jgi:hypothetical protein
LRKGIVANYPEVSVRKLATTDSRETNLAPLGAFSAQLSQVAASRFGSSARGDNQLDNIGTIEKRLWSSADTLRANSNFASNEYFLPVMGLIFLRHAYSRFLTARAEIEPTLPKRGGKTRPLTKEDFSGRGAIFLQPEAQFDHLASLPDT